MQPLAHYIDQEAAREAARRRAHEAEQARHRGVAYSGMGPGPFRARTEEEIAEAAATDKADHDAFLNTPQDRYLRGLSALQNAAESARACYARGLNAREAERAATCFAEAADALGIALDALHHLARPYLQGQR